MFLEDTIPDTRAIEFVQNYSDLSTDKGYQFKFFCDMCGNGYMSSFKASAIGMASSAAQVAGSLLSGSKIA